MRTTLGALALAPAILLATPATTGPGPGPVWEMASSSQANLSAADPALAQADLDQPPVLLQGSAPLAGSPVPAGWSSTAEERWTSYAQFAADLKAGDVPAYVRVAHYDNEKWSATPTAEQRDPALYEREFCQAAHAAGLGCATGPARDLCPVAFPSFHGTNTECYLDEDMAGAAAEYADWTDLQGQAMEGDTSAYQSFVDQAAAQATAANPSVVVLANLSPTAVPGVTGAQLAADLGAVCPSAVAGSYWTITADGAAVAGQAFTAIEPDGPGSTGC